MAQSSDTQPRDIPLPVGPNRRAALPWVAMVVIGTTWGATGPLSKLAVSTGHHPVGITFWNTLISAVVLTALLLLSGRQLPLDRRHLVFFLGCGLLGTALPNSLYYAGYQHLSVGVMSLVIALVPMATLLLALPLRIEPPSPRRLLGIALGAAAVAMIVLPRSSLPDPTQAVWVVLPLIVTLSYAGENIFIATTRPPRCDTLTVICGLSWGGLALLAPVMLAADAWVELAPLGPPEIAILAVTALHIVAYFGYIWLIGQAGPVFASQVGYVVTGAGMAFGMVIYGERHSLWIWGALVLMFAGLALVRPRR